MTDMTAEQALRDLIVSALSEGYYNAAAVRGGASISGATIWAHENADSFMKTKRDNLQALTALRVPDGWKLAGHVAVCGDGSVFYEYFTETAYGISAAMAADGWEGMSVQPVYMPTAAPAPADELAEHHQSPCEWNDGEPSRVYRDEWFIAKMACGRTVVARSLPEDHSYDYTT